MSINIVALGGSGAGKTAYLASIYHSLAFPTKFSFYLNIQSDNQRKLTDYYKFMCDKNEGFPPGTMDIEDWDFQCKVNGGGDLTFCEFNFVDYGGGNINKTIEQGGKLVIELREYIKKANIILAFLDGAEILKLMEGKDVNQWLNRDIINIFDEIKKVREKFVPVHFVITKWDLIKLHGKYDLKEIKIKLKYYYPFNSKIFENTNEYPTRLIPISSLGDNFAVPEFDDKGNIIYGEKDSIILRKTGKMQIEPYYTEVALAYALVDTIKLAYKELDEYYNKLNFWNKIYRRVKAFLLNPIAEFLPPGFGWLTNSLAEMFINSKWDDLEKVKIDHKEFTTAINELAFIIKKFENDYGNECLP